MAGHDDDIELLQVHRGEVLFRKVCVRNADAVKRQPPPAGILRRRNPGMHQSDARRFHRMHRDLRQPLDADDFHAQLLCQMRQAVDTALPEIISIDDQCSGSKIAPAGAERLVCCQHGHIRQPEAQQGDLIVRGVVDQKESSATVPQLSAQAHIAVQQRHFRLQNGRVIDAKALYLMQHRQSPACVVIRRFRIFGKILFIQQHPRQGAIGLVEPDDIGALLHRDGAGFFRLCLFIPSRHAPA